MNNKELEINAKVRVSSFANKIGTVSKINKKTCLVLVDNMKVEVPLDSVVLVNEKKKNKTLTQAKIKKTKKVKNKRTLDLHGLTKDEARTKIEFFLSDCLLEDCDTCIIIHGIGTGALKELTHKILSNLKSVKNYKFEDSNPGQTKVFL